MRVNFNYFISEAVFQYIVDAVALVADFGWRLVPQYRFNPDTGLWRNEHGPVEPPLRLTQVGYDAEGMLTFPRHHDTAPESVLQQHIAEAITLFESLPEFDGSEHVADERLTDDFERLRWFDLPSESLLH